MKYLYHVLCPIPLALSLILLIWPSQPMNTGAGNDQVGLILLTILLIVLLVLTGFGLIIARFIKKKNSLDVVIALAVAVSPVILLILYWVTTGFGMHTLISN